MQSLRAAAAAWAGERRLTICGERAVPRGLSQPEGSGPCAPYGGVDTSGFPARACASPGRSGVIPSTPHLELLGKHLHGRRSCRLGPFLRCVLLLSASLPPREPPDSGTFLPGVGGGGCSLGAHPREGGPQSEFGG